MSAAPWPELKRDLVAILRGIEPHETRDIVAALADAGFEAIEIPLNSPDAFNSVEIAAKAFGSECLIGAGTILTVEEVRRVNDAGGKLFVSPNTQPDVIRSAASCGMVCMPGVFTPTEALSALDAGASGLKFFPATVLGPVGISNIQAILPKGTVIAAVGGVGEANFGDYAKVGIRAFGLGSSIYKPGASALEIAKKARSVISAYDISFDVHAPGSGT
ncbi:MAG: 2-dehydro-3-deoxy-6-phosphogalactonate aldolase [Rhizobiaceae bacterium]